MPKKYSIKRDAHVHVKLEPALKQNVELILSTIGMSIPDAISLFYRQCVAENGLPFNLEISEPLEIGA